MNTPENYTGRPGALGAAHMNDPEPDNTTMAELLAAIMELTMEERAELLAMWKDGAKA